MKLSTAGCLAVLLASLVAACNGGSDPDPTPTPTAEVSPTTSAVPTPPPSNQATVRVGYINLMAPIGVEEEVPVERETFEARINLAIEQWNGFAPDLLGVSEAAWVKGLGKSAWTRLAEGLGMEGILLARANPWISGQSQAESDDTVEAVGWEEGEYLLSRFPIIEANRYDLRPPPSATESRAILHAVVSAPEPIGEIDVYVTRFGGSEDILARQARSLHSTISLTHSASRAIIVMGDFGAPPGSEALSVLIEAGYLDPLADQADAVTCCRQAIRFEASELTPTPTATPDPSLTPDPEATPTAPVQPEPGPADVVTRTDYILVRQWSTSSWQLVSQLPRELPNGQALYASDHNGLGIVFDVSEPATAVP